MISYRENVFSSVILSTAFLTNSNETKSDGFVRCGHLRSVTSIHNLSAQDDCVSSLAWLGAMGGPFPAVGVSQQLEMVSVLRRG